MIKDPKIYVADEMLKGGKVRRVTYLFDGDAAEQAAQFNQELTKEQIIRISAILNEGKGK
jgi:hypothetical protein